MTVTHTVTPYQEAYEYHLGDQLIRLAERWHDLGCEAVNEFTDRARRVRYFGYEGPFTYALGWDEGVTIEAELRSGIARHIQSGMSQEGERPSSSMILEQVLHELRRTTLDVFSVGMSAGHTYVRFEMGKAAEKILSEFTGLRGAEYAAYRQTRHSLVGSLDEAAHQARQGVMERRGKMQRARNPVRVNLLRSQLEAFQSEADQLTKTADERFRELGGGAFEF